VALAGVRTVGREGFQHTEHGGGAEFTDGRIRAKNKTEERTDPPFTKSVKGRPPTGTRKEKKAPRGLFLLEDGSVVVEHYQFSFKAN
jgi:hypothetical protein